MLGTKLIRMTKALLVFSASVMLISSAAAEDADPLVTAAKAGNANAEAALAFKVLMGYDGRNPDPELAMQWYEKAANQGLPAAQNALGGLYERGAASRLPDHREAAKWYLRAAAEGFPQAQLAIGRLYEEGKGVPASDDDALEWYRKAAGQGLDEARERAESLTTRRVAAAEAAKVTLEQQQRAEIQNRKLTEAFRKTVERGAESNCGLVVSTIGSIATVQGPAPIGQFAVRIDQLYPPGVATCDFFNGRYQKPALPY